MDNASEKQKILHSIQLGLKNARIKNIEAQDYPNSEFYQSVQTSLRETFIEELEKVNGKCIICNNLQEVSEKLKQINESTNLGMIYCPDAKYHEILEQSGTLFTDKFENPEKIKSGISTCEFLIARFGSVMVSSALNGGRRIFSFPEIHLVIAFENQLVMEIEEGLAGIQSRYAEELPSQIINITGPSRTADIEKTLILGAHGPKQLIVLLINS